MIRPTVDMMEALRLTRQGKLEEAMAVLRGGTTVAEATSSRATDKASIIDMVRPADPTRALGQWHKGARSPARQPAKKWRPLVVYFSMAWVTRKRRPAAKLSVFAGNEH